ncbi:MAG: hypothetical protein E4H00_09180 [Myxococcales bacterium]|nr:MAG: hypothetical protein E4H00_09180 [Myxococcales bacterium]
MKTVVNKTRSALKIPLPRGKSLRLGPNGSGQIRDEHAEHAALQKLIAAGDIEIVTTETHADGVVGSATGRGSAGRGHVKPNVRHRESDR